MTAINERAKEYAQYADPLAVNDQGLTMYKYLCRADRMCHKLAGVSIFDLQDRDWYTAWDEGWSIVNEVCDLLREEGYDVGNPEGE